MANYDAKKLQDIAGKYPGYGENTKPLVYTERSIPSTIEMPNTGTIMAIIGVLIALIIIILLTVIINRLPKNQKDKK
jgi:hypothetical protein